MLIQDILKTFELEGFHITEGNRPIVNPATGQIIAQVQDDTPESVETKLSQSVLAFKNWRTVPAPKRGELIYQFGKLLREYKVPLGTLITAESGKIVPEGQGEVQEMIDICDFAVGLSRQLYGKTIPSERPQHRIQEVWHPLGPVGIITAFNFPAAVWSWNAVISLVCGNSVLWKPSEKTPLTALAVQNLLEKAASEVDLAVPQGLSQVVLGNGQIGELLVDSTQVPLISATGSCAMGKVVGPRVAQRLGRSILELGGNNAMIVCESADLDLAVDAIVFSAVGTAGQRCTSLRRLFVHKNVHESLLWKLKKAYNKLKIGNPMEPEMLVGPLIDKRAFDEMETTLKAVQEEGATVHGGQRILAEQYPEAYYVQPALVEMPEQTDMMWKETFAPLLFVMPFSSFETVINLHNEVPQGLSSCIFTQNIQEMELFLSAQGSDCGMANVNIGPSGAEIGGAFGGEKETGGGREAGSDAWKSYMRRMTCTINGGKSLPLAQGIEFG